MFLGFWRVNRSNFFNQGYYNEFPLYDMRTDNHLVHPTGVGIPTKYWVHILINAHKTIKEFSWEKLSLFIAICAAALIVLSNPALANPSSLTIKDVFDQEIKLLAYSDVENDIPRRTDFVLKLYASNMTGQKPEEVRKIYEEEYFQQSNKKFPRSLMKNPFTLMGGVLAGTFLLGVLIGRFLGLISKLQVKKATINIPFFNVGSLELSVDSAAKKAAWLLYVELSTRIATQSLGDNDGLLREALNSLYKIFETTRQILRDAGAEVGIDEKSVGGISMKVLNDGLRPFLAKWHPKLERWEAERTDPSSHQAHEQQWADFILMRNELALLRQGLQEYADMLGKIAALRD
jgi:hypothetical protein